MTDTGLPPDAITAATAATGSAFRVWYGEAADAYEQGYVNGAAQAYATERERIRQLAVDVGATYCAPFVVDAPFADLLDGDA